MSGRNATFEQLRAILQQADLDHERAKAVFGSTANEQRALPRVPTGLCEPLDGQQFREAFQTEVEARERNLDALHKFNYFAIYGTLPPGSGPHRKGTASSSVSGNGSPSRHAPPKQCAA
jgi:hypothetical protein